MARQTYSDRNKLLREMGFASYQAYLDSELWKGIKAKGMSTKPACRLCGAAAVVVHHVGYGRDVLLGTNEGIAKLVPLCDRCHTKVELTPSGEKRSLAESQSKYQAMFCKKGKVNRSATKTEGKDWSRSEMYRSREFDNYNVTDKDRDCLAHIRSREGKNWKGRKGWWLGRFISDWHKRRCYRCGAATKPCWCYCKGCRRFLTYLLENGY